MSCLQHADRDDGRHRARAAAPSTKGSPRLGGRSSVSLTEGDSTRAGSPRQRSDEYGDQRPRRSLRPKEYAPDLTTDIMAYFLKGGSPPTASGGTSSSTTTPTVQHSDIEATATAIRALRVLGAPTVRCERAVRRATTWLMAARPRTVDERAWQLMGLEWAGVRYAARAHPVGGAGPPGRASVPTEGWAPGFTLTSDARYYGPVLVALLRAGALRPSDHAYRRGVDYLLRSQLADGSW